VMGIAWDTGEAVALALGAVLLVQAVREYRRARYAVRWGAWYEDTSGTPGSNLYMGVGDHRSKRPGCVVVDAPHDWAEHSDWVK
jgi:hypothetical protein